MKNTRKTEKQNSSVVNDRFKKGKNNHSISIQTAPSQKVQEDCFNHKTSTMVDWYYSLLSEV